MNEQMQHVALDEQALQRLRALDPQGTHGVLQRVLGAFDTSLQRALQQIEELPAASDQAATETVLRIAHTLKSSAASVGALDLSASCISLEKRLRASDAAVPPPQPCRRQLLAEAEQLGSAIAHAQEAVRAMLRA